MELAKSAHKLQIPLSPADRALADVPSSFGFWPRT